MRWSRLTAASALACLMTVTAGCDGGDDKKREDLEAAAAAALGEGKDARAKAIEDKEAEERRKRYAEKKAKEEAEKAKLDEIAATVVEAPDKPSKHLEAACDSMVEIYEEWVKAVYFDDDGFQLDFFDHKKKNLGVVKGRCAKLASVEATDCMVEVIRSVSAEDFSEPDRKLIQAQPDYLFDKCVEKFAPDKL